jgi:hypothetical protein
MQEYMNAAKNYINEKKFSEALDVLTEVLIFSLFLSSRLCRIITITYQLMFSIVGN